jgi:hypothetical protein
MPAPVHLPGGSPACASARHGAVKAYCLTFSVWLDILARIWFNRIVSEVADGCLTLKGNTMTEQVQRELPATLALKLNNKSEFTLVSGDKVAKEKRIPANDPIVVLRFLVDLEKGKKVINQYAAFCPDYDEDGNLAYLYGKDGQVLRSKTGRPVYKTIPWAKALKEAEDGQRTVALAFGKWSTFKLNVLRPKAERKAPKAADEYFDIAAYFSDKTKK